MVIQRYFLCCFILMSTPAWAKMGSRTYQLQTCVNRALEHSPTLKQREKEWLSSEYRAQSERARMGPRLSLEATYRHISEVPVFQAAPTAPAVSFGANKNYSYGPSLQWPLWNSGLLYYSAQSLRDVADSKKESYEMEKLKIIQQTRLAYFHVQLSLQQMRSIADSLRLTSDQYRDISIRRRAGTLSQIDDLSAHQELLNRQHDYYDAQIQVSKALRELLALTGEFDEDVSSPVDARIAVEKIPVEKNVSLYVECEDYATLRSQFQNVSDYRWNDQHPSVRVFQELSAAANKAKQSITANHFPMISLLAKSTRDYPNGPILESVHQNTIGVQASWSLFEWNRYRNLSKEQESLTEAHRNQEEQVRIELQKEWNNARDSITKLQSQYLIDKEAMAESQQLSQLVYDSYKGGRTTFLEVENANLKALLASIKVAQTEVQTLIQYSLLESLSTKEK